MSEQQVTVDGVTRPLLSPFKVIATQNNLYDTGTFPLPEPQLDRFLLTVSMDLPDQETQAKLLQLHARKGIAQPDEPAILHVDEITACQQLCLAIPVNDRICRYITSICDAARKTDGGRSALSARASISIMRAAQAAAWLENAKAVYPDHVKAVAEAVLSHRLVLRDSRHGQSSDASSFISSILASVPVP